jgi:ABC-type Mn2+/Zn2+ transport system permease subunit
MNKIDITSQKVIVPTLLFAALSSGVHFFTKKAGSNVIGTTLIVHALLFAVIYYALMKFVFKKNLTRADIVMPLLLYVVLTPGVLLTLPPGSKGVFMSGQTSTPAVGVHTLVFAIVFALLRSKFPAYY